MKTLQEREQRMQQMQELFQEVEKDNKKMKSILHFLKQANKRASALSEYYHGDWMEDSEILSNESDKHFLITNEDSIYNELIDQHNYQKKIIKTCADILNKNL